ncbi:Flp family type IVb pilin [Bremerella alba]|uniref:Uncharacterized protein n=1 Tax=Bremerella alba TaxID=980252 RepID=A0A7V8VAC3_9BACT|nr:hypothetical protein [Bremerella alba]MBA2117889.1 hypothetical protein [Bremerella alba]
MLTTLKKLWNDERGFVNSMELILIATLAVLGLIVGLATFRDAVTQELGDSAAAVGQLNQSYSVFVGDNNAGGMNPGPQINENNGVVTVTTNLQFVNTQATFNNFSYEDLPDEGDVPDVAGDAPAEITFVAPTNEGGP